MRIFWKAAAWMLAVGLVAYALAVTPLHAVGQTLSHLSVWQIALVAVLNAGIIVLFGLRWWWLLRTQGYPIPYRAIVRYRLAAFGVSYFTPGPQFGGEPLQVYFLKKKHAVPTPAALAALSLDKLFELLANFTFLAFGVLAVIWGGYFNPFDSLGVLASIAVLALLPWGYLLALYFDLRIFTKLSVRLFSWPRLQKFSGRFHTAIRQAEAQMAAFCRHQTGSLVGLMLVSAGIWAALVCEYWLVLHFLGARLAIGETLVFITAARLAFLMPLPGGLGSLEVSQVYAAQALHLGSELGISVGLIIRIRDIAFGILGLLWGGLLTRRNDSVSPHKM